MPGNGRLTRSELRRVYHPTLTVFLAASGGAAAGWNTMNLYLYWEVGPRSRVIGNGPDSYYRPIRRQVYWRQWWCAQGKCQNAAVPGFSNHGDGKAVDTGRRRTVWRYGRPFGWGPCTDAPWEPWHTKQCRAFRRPNPGPNPLSPILRRGSGGRGQARHVRTAQRLLRHHGINVRVDGDFGPRMTAAVKRFQRRAGLKRPDGVIGPRTWSALKRKRRKRRK